MASRWYFVATGPAPTSPSLNLDGIPSHQAFRRVLGELPRVFPRPHPPVGQAQAPRFELAVEAPHPELGLDEVKGAFRVEGKGAERRERRVESWTVWALDPQL